MNCIEKDFFTGINYWASKNSINMWKDFDEDSIDKDLTLLEKAGITLLRVFPLWPIFQPLKALYTPEGVYEYRFDEAPLPDTKAGRAGVSEKACQEFETFCTLAKNHNMKLIVGLITGHMSYRNFMPLAFAGKSLLSDPTVMKWQLRFVKYFVKRFKDNRAVAGWDLGNEVTNLNRDENFTYDSFYVWASLMADAIKLTDPSHPVISGVCSSSIERSDCSLKTVGEYCDIHTTHPYNIFDSYTDPLTSMKPVMDLCYRCKISEDISKIPTFVQEFGSIGYTNCSQSSEADFYRACLMSSLAHNLHGTMWWCAFDQGHLTYAPYDWNNIGSDYGFFDKNNKPKPITDVNINFKKLLDTIGGNLPKHITEGTIIVPRDDIDMESDVIRASYILSKRANLDVNFSYALDEIPDSSLYILPSINGNKPITKRRLDSVLEKVSKGSVLYLSVGKTLFRDIPEIFGVTFSHRMQVQKDRIVYINDEKLPLKSSATLAAESWDCEVLAYDEENIPVFFKKKYKKGFVYLLTMPLEEYLSNKDGAFYSENEPRYDIIYRELAASSGINRLVEVSSPFICTTEHQIDENTYYIFAINYHNKAVEANILINDKFKVSKVWGNPPQNKTISIGRNDGVIFKISK